MKNATKRSRLWVGYKTGNMEVFRAVKTPTQETHGDRFGAAIGPFRTLRGAQYMATYGRGNPHLRCVADAERLAALHAGQSTLAADYARHLAAQTRHPSAAELV